MLAEKNYTSEEDFQKLRESMDTPVELIDDIVYMSPAPATNHQRILGELFARFREFLQNSKCEVLLGINLRLYDEAKNKIGDVIPDLSVFCDLSKDEGAFIEKIPVIAIEIVSPSSVYLDNFKKAYLYKRVGVQEYWVVNLKKKLVTVWDFKNDEQYIYNSSEKAKSTVFGEFIIDLEELFHL